MKSYYQYKKTDYTLPKPIYAKVVKTIAAYDYYQSVINGIKEKSENAVTDKDMAIKADAEHYIESIDRALENWVIEPLQKPIFLHVARGIEYTALEDMCYVSASVLKRSVQKFVYGVAKELGEIF